MKFTVYDRSARSIDPPPQALTGCNQALSVVLLLGCTGAAVHNEHGQWCHITVESGQLCEQLSILPDHKASSGSSIFVVTAAMACLR
jgi:hypothetical protein